MPPRASAKGRLGGSPLADDALHTEPVSPLADAEWTGRTEVYKTGQPAVRQLTVPEPYQGDNGGDLDARERADLASCEAAIDTLRLAFWAAGKALQVIRDGRLYRTTHGTFDDYCADRWEMTRQQASRLILAWPLAELLSPMGDKINERQVRALLPLSDQYGTDAAVAAYRTVAETDGVKVTAAVLEGAVSALPDGTFDAEQVAAQIRAHLTGTAPPRPDPPAPSAADTFASAPTKFRTILQRLRVAASEDPAQARATFAELRKLLDDLEQDIPAP